MDLGRFVKLTMWLDDREGIFVLDGESGSVSKFAIPVPRPGSCFSRAKGLALASFNDGRGLLASDDVVYVVERGAKRIRRFQYSVSESDIPDDEKEP